MEGFWEKLKKRKNMERERQRKLVLDTIVNSKLKSQKSKVENENFRDNRHSHILENVRIFFVWESWENYGRLE
jgi:tRNA G37 N-methylase Trm5